MFKNFTVFSLMAVFGLFVYFLFIFKSELMWGEGVGIGCVAGQTQDRPREEIPPHRPSSCRAARITAGSSASSPSRISA